jgi:two-component system response regulator LytT
MKDLESKLTAPEFARAHRSYILRIDKITSIEDNFINLAGKAIPIGKNYKDELMKLLNTM